MESGHTSLQYVVALALLVGGIGGTTADIVGAETISPAYFAVAIAAGAAALPESALTNGVCRLRSRLPV